MIDAFIRHWQQLAARERRLVAGGAVALGAIVLWFWWFEPAWHGRQDIRAQLPMLRQELAEVDRLATIARELSSHGAARETATPSRRQLEASLDRAGLLASLSALTVTGRTFDLRFDEVPYRQWLEWLDTATRELRVRVVDVTLARSAANGLVSGRLVLEAPQ